MARHPHIDDLERACVEQGARVASLKRDAREKESIDAAVSQLLEQKAALKAALEEMIHAAEASGDATGLPALQERLAPLLPKGKGKKKATCVPPAPPPPHQPSSLDRTAEWETFLTVRKNRDACIHWVIRLAQAAEREWDDAPLRHARLELLRDCLESLREHSHADCRELSGLVPRMLQSLDQGVARRPAATAPPRYLPGPRAGGRRGRRGRRGRWAQGARFARVGLSPTPTPSWSHAPTAQRGGLPLKACLTSVPLTYSC